MASTACDFVREFRGDRHSSLQQLIMTVVISDVVDALLGHEADARAKDNAVSVLVLCSAYPIQPMPALCAWNVTMLKYARHCGIAIQCQTLAIADLHSLHIVSLPTP